MENKKIFTIAWDFYPKTSGESTVCRRSLTNSRHSYDIVSGFFGKEEQQIKNCHIYSIKGEKYLLFSIRALKLFKELNKINTYKVLYTRVHPANAHFAGCLIKCFYPKLKWIVYFSDPVWNSPFITPFSFFKKDKVARPRYIVMKIMGIFSKIAIIKSDILVFNNDRLAKYVLGRNYDKYKQKIVIIPYGHDGLKSNNNKIKLKEGKFCFAHVGKLYGERNLDNIVKALKILKKEKSDFYNNISIFLVGEIDEYNINLIKENNLQDVFEVIGLVEYEKSLYYINNADCLLIIDTNFKEQKYNIYTPSKIFDYMASCNLILAITANNTSTTDITTPAQILTANHNGHDICNEFMKIMEGGLQPDLELFDKFNCKNYIKILDDRIDRMIEEYNVQK